MRWKLLGIAGTALLVAFAADSPARGSSIEVQLKLPQKARLDLKGKKSIAVAPFQVETKEDTQRFQGRDIDVQKEFARYLVKVIRRETELKVIETGALDLPVTDFEQLAKQTDFWQALGERTGADLLLSGGLDFDIQDKTGYRTEEYVSPFNGQTYYRQVLVEQTGFEYDILMQVYDAKSGTLVYQDNFKDFQKFEGESTDPLRGMFENLLSLEDKIVGVFTQKEVETTRTLFTD
jgi:TolB-like protein